MDRYIFVFCGSFVYMCAIVLIWIVFLGECVSLCIYVSV